MYGELFELVAEDLELGGQTAAALRGHEEDPADFAVALRLAGTVHRLVLAGEVPELAVFYPSAGGQWDPVLGWEAFQQVLESHRDEIRAGLEQAPQTNEVGRSAALMGGLLRLTSRLPVRLCEIGSSAGLNLRADHFAYDGGVGDPDSPVDLRGGWQGRAPVPRQVEIAERIGSDIAPVDPGTREGALTVTAYVWPDQTERLDRLRGALEVARRVPATVLRQDAETFVRGLALESGHVTVLWHSVMWQYLSAREQQAAAEAIDELGRQATADHPFARLFLEPDGADFQVVLREWPGERRLLGIAHPHGVPVTWK